MKDKIIEIIAAYFEKEVIHIWHSEGEKMAFLKPTEYPEFSEQKFCQEIAAEIEKELRVIVYPKDFPHDKLFDHMAAEHGLTLTQTELGDIIHIARG